MADPASADRRRSPRARLNLIVRLHAPPDAGDQPPWVAVTTTGDASEHGVSVLLEHPLPIGQMVRLQVLPPLPRQLGGRPLEGPSAEVVAVVRGSHEEEGVHRVGLMFVDPAAAVRAERRSEERYPVSASFVVQKVDEMGAILKEALTVAANLSRHGALLTSAVSFATGDIVMLREATGVFEGLGEVTHTWADPAGMHRLHVRFLYGRSLDPRGLADG